MITSKKTSASGTLAGSATKSLKKATVSAFTVVKSSLRKMIGTHTEKTTIRVKSVKKNFLKNECEREENDCWFRHVKHVAKVSVEKN